MKQRIGLGEDILVGMLAYGVLAIIIVLVYYGYVWLLGINFINVLMVMSGLAVGLMLLLIFKLTGRAILHKYPNIIRNNG